MTGLTVDNQLPTNPAGLSIVSTTPLANTCGGTPTISASRLQLAGGTIPAGAGAGEPGRCFIEVQVKALPPVGVNGSQSYRNIILANQVSVDGFPSAVGPGEATLTTPARNPIVGTKTVRNENDQALVYSFGTSRVTITLSNTNPYAITGLNTTDTLPARTMLQTPSNLASTCGGNITSTTGATDSVVLTGGTIAANSSCSITFDVTHRIPYGGQHNVTDTNRITQANTSSDQGATFAADVTAQYQSRRGVVITKSFNPATVAVGGTSTLRILINNWNMRPLNIASFTDEMPAGVRVVGPGEFVPARGGTVPADCVGEVSFTATTVTLSNATIAASPGLTNTGERTCAINIPVVVDDPGPHRNVIPAGTMDGHPYVPAEATITTAGLTMRKGFSPSNRVRTGIAELQISVTNRGTAPIDLTSITDDLATMGGANMFRIADAPAPILSNCGSATVTATPGQTLITVTGGTIAAGATCLVRVPVQSTSQAPLGFNLANNININTIPVGGIVTSAGSNTAPLTAEWNVGRPTSASKSFTPSTIVAGQTSRLRITFSRAAYAAAGQVNITDILPAGLVVADTPNANSTCGGTITAVPGSNEVRLTNGSLGAFITTPSACILSVDVTAAATGSYLNTIPAANMTLVTAVGTESPATDASATLVVEQSNITINKRFNPSDINIGSNTVVTLSVLNTGARALDLTGVRLQDNLPDGLLVADVPNVSSLQGCTGDVVAVAGSNSITLENASIAAGATCLFSVTLTPQYTGTFVNILPEGRLTSDRGLSNSNTASATVTAAGNADLAITKDDGITAMVAGGTTTYTLTVTNNSDLLAAINLPVLDPEPTGMTFERWTCTATAGSACDVAEGAGGIDTTVDLIPLGVATFTVTAKLSSAFTGSSIRNFAEVRPAVISILDPVPGNNQDDDTNTVTRSADLSISKTNSATQIVSGQTTTYTVTARNAGPSDALGAILRDTPEAGLSACRVDSCTAAGTSECPVPLDFAALAAGVAIPRLAPDGDVTVLITCDVD